MALEIREHIKLRGDDPLDATAKPPLMRRTAKRVNSESS